MDANKSIWITGAGGLVGNHLIRNARAARVIGLTREMLDLTDFAAVERQFESETPGLVIHCAAMSRSPDCQANPALARRINVEATALLAGLAREVDFIFFSTDLVFDGRKGDYVETDAVNPLSIYGETKAAAEQIVARNPRHTIVRLALCGGVSPKGRTAFNEELEGAWRAGRSVKLFSDEFRTPLPASVAARAVWELAAQSAPGVYHLGGAQRLSRLEIGQSVAARHPELAPHYEAPHCANIKARRVHPTSRCGRRSCSGCSRFRCPD